MSAGRRTAREAIADAAQKSGWDLATPREDERIMNFVTYTRPVGRRYVRIQFDVRGRVVSASTAKRSISGRDLRDRIIDLLEKQ